MKKNNNSIVKKIIRFIFLFIFIIIFYESSYADPVSDYADELVNNFDISISDATKNAQGKMDNLVKSMESSQSDSDEAYKSLDKRVNALKDNDSRKDKALDELNEAKTAVSDFNSLSASDNVVIESHIGGIMPTMTISKTFSIAEENASQIMTEVNKILIVPDSNGLPVGDIMEDFIPQIIRQLFRFAWLGVLIAIISSGIMFIVSFDNEERVTKAKHMIYFTLIGVAVISLAFALVKAVTDIDFFRFI